MSKSDYYEGRAFMYQFYRGYLNVCPGEIKLERTVGDYNNRVFIRARDHVRFNFRHTAEMTIPEQAPGGSVRCAAWSPVRTKATDDRFVELVVNYLKQRYAEAKEECDFYEEQWYEVRTAQRAGEIKFRER